MIGSLEFVILFQSNLITEQNGPTHFLIYCHSQLVELLGKNHNCFLIQLDTRCLCWIEDRSMLMINLKTEEHLSTFARNENS
jgi:hypothetical protein